MPSFINSIKAHHDSLNAAFSTYYAPGSSTTSTPTSSTEPSRNNSIAMATSEQKKAPTNASKAWTAIKQHHRDMNEAYTAFYSPGASPAGSRNNSAAPSPRHSSEHVRSEEEPEKPRNYQKIWKAVKTRAVEHHRSVNAAYATTYNIHH